MGNELRFKHVVSFVYWFKDKHIHDIDIAKLLMPLMHWLVIIMQHNSKLHIHDIPKGTLGNSPQYLPTQLVF